MLVSAQKLFSNWKNTILVGKMLHLKETEDSE